MPFYYNKGQEITERETQNGNRIRLNLAILLNTPSGRKRCIILYITLSSFYYLAHESRTLALIDYIDNEFVRAERGHLSLRLFAPICQSAAKCFLAPWRLATQVLFFSPDLSLNRRRQTTKIFSQAVIHQFQITVVFTPLHFG